MKTISNYAGITARVDNVEFKRRWQNDGTSCGIYLRDTRVATGKRANLKSEKVGDEVGFPLYITLEDNAGKYNYSLLYSYNTNTFAIAPMSIGSGSVCKTYHKADAETKAAFVRDIANSIAEVFDMNDMAAVQPVAHRVRLPESEGVFSSRNKSKVGNTLKPAEIDSNVQEVLLKLGGLIYNMGPGGQLIDINPHAYDQFTGKCMTDEEAGKKISGGNALDWSSLQQVEGHTTSAVVDDSPSTGSSPDRE